MDSKFDLEDTVKSMIYENITITITMFDVFFFLFIDGGPVNAVIQYDGQLMHLNCTFFTRADTSIEYIHVCCYDSRMRECYGNSDVWKPVLCTAQCCCDQIELRISWL